MNDNALTSIDNIDFIVQTSPDAIFDFYQGEMHITNSSDGSYLKDYYIVGSFFNGAEDKLTVGIKEPIMFLNDSFVVCKLDLMFHYFNSDISKVQDINFLDKDFLIASVADDLLLIDKNYLLSKDQVNTENSNIPAMLMHVHDAKPVVDLIKEYVFQKQSDHNVKGDYKYLCLASDYEEGKFLCGSNYDI